MGYVLILLCGCALVAFCSIPNLRGADKPAVAAAAEPAAAGVSIGEMRIQTGPAMSYLYAPAETSFTQMGEPNKAGVGKVFAAARDAKPLIVRATVRGV